MRQCLSIYLSVIMRKGLSKRIQSFVGLLTVAIVQSVYSQGAVPAVVATEADRISALEKQIKDLQVELQKLRTQPAATEEQERQWRDLLKNSSGMKLNFYGEAKYFSAKGADGNYFDPHRFVLAPSYRINDWMTFHSEFEVEHGGVDESTTGRFDGEVEVEQMFIDLKLNDFFNIRSPGVHLVPVGRINLFHEPTTFYSVDRPLLYNSIIPSTWMESALGGIWGNHEGFGYSFMISQGLTEQSKQISASKGVRDSRPRLRNKGDPSSDLGYSGRITYSGIDNLQTSASGYLTSISGTGGESTAALWDVEAVYRVPKTGLELRGDFAMWHFSNPERLSKNQTAGDDNFGDRMYGWHLEAAYHLWPDAWKKGRGAEMDFVPFVRYTDLHTVAGKIPSGLTPDYSKNCNYIETGFAWYLSKNVVLKGTFLDNLSNATEQYFGLGVGINF